MKKWICQLVQWLEKKRLPSESGPAASAPAPAQNPETEPELVYKKRDILYCRMPVEKQDRLNIASGHEVRPYVVMKTGERGFWGYPMTTSHDRFAYDQKMIYKKTTIANGEQKDSYFLFVPAVYVPEDHIVSHFDHLDRRWERAIDRRIACQKRQRPYCQYFSFGTGPLLERGDIVQQKNGSLALLCRTLSEERCVLFPLLDKKPKGSAFHIRLHQQVYWIDPDHSCMTGLHDVFLYSILPPFFIRKFLKRFDLALQKQTLAPVSTHSGKGPKPIPPEEIYYLYEPGTVIEESFSRRQFIYFFSYRSDHYIFPDDLHMRGKYRLSTVCELSHQPVAVATENEMRNAFNNFLSGRKPYTSAIRKVRQDYFENYCTQ